VSAVVGARAALALLVAGVASTLVLVSLQVFVGAVASGFAASEREVGWLAAADMAGSALASLGIIPLLGRVRRRRAAALGVAAMIAGNALSMLATTLPAVLGARLLAGAGGGIMLSLAFVGLCRSASPDRYFAIYVFAQLTLQVLALAGFPPLLAAFGLDAIFGLLAALAAATLALVPLFPHLPGYGLVGVRGSIKFAERSELFVDFENIFDKSYRGISWGIDGAGRGVTLRYRYEF
jgi:MFS family permease